MEVCFAWTLKNGRLFSTPAYDHSLDFIATERLSRFLLSIISIKIRRRKQRFDQAISLSGHPFATISFHFRAPPSIHRPQRLFLATTSQFLVSSHSFCSLLHLFVGFFFWTFFEVGVGRIEILLGGVEHALPRFPLCGASSDAHPTRGIYLCVSRFFLAWLVWLVLVNWSLIAELELQIAEQTRLRLFPFFFFFCSCFVSRWTNCWIRVNSPVGDGELLKYINKNAYRTRSKICSQISSSHNTEKN